MAAPLSAPSLVSEQPSRDVPDDLGGLLHRELDLIEVVHDLIELISLIVQPGCGLRDSTGRGRVTREREGASHVQWSTPDVVHTGVYAHDSPANLADPRVPSHLRANVESVMRQPFHAVEPGVDLVDLLVALLYQLDHAHL